MQPCTSADLDSDVPGDDDVEIVESPSSAPLPHLSVQKKQLLDTTPKSKRLKQEEQLWCPTKPAHCSDAIAYLRDFPLERDIFNYMCLSSKKYKNWNSSCMLCPFTRAGSTTVILVHFLEQKCSLKAVPDEAKEGLADKLMELADKRVKAYSRSSDNASKARVPREGDDKPLSNIGAWLASSATRQQALLQDTAEMFIACNLPASLGENPFFRNYIRKMTGGRLTTSEADVLKRKRLTGQMDNFAKERREESLKVSTENASRFGGTLLVDGWTAARAVGTIGVTVCSLTISHVLPIVLSGVERSRAKDYHAKLEEIVDWKNINFICTDGASNMILLGDRLREEKHVLPNLCAAQGLSLIVHYIGKVFESRSSMFSKVAGIIAYFNRSPHRLVVLRREAGSSIGFVRFCKTRMAYQTLALLRVLRLRESAQKAMVTLRKEKEDEDENIDTFSKLSQVDSSLHEDRLFKEVEIFCRVTLPVLYAMREVDRGTPIAGFVYWLHYHVESQVDQLMEKLVAADPSYVRLRDEISSAIRFVWDKRHRPVLSFAYLTNPLFQDDLSREPDVFELDPNFSSDVEEVLICMVQKRSMGTANEDEITSEQIAEKAVEVSNELADFLRHGAMSEMNRAEAKKKLAADFWSNSSICRKFPNLAWYARRVHGMTVVTSRLERFFSHVGNIQTERPASMHADRAAMYAAAHQQLIEGRNDTTNAEIQVRLLNLVKRCEDLQTEKTIVNYDDTPELKDLDTWLEKVRSDRLEYLYKRSSTSFPSSAPGEEGEPTAEVSATDYTEPDQSLLKDLDEAFEFRNIRRSNRTRKPTRKLNL